jgi:hypothetical protein
MTWPSKEITLFGISTFSTSESYESAGNYLRSIWDQQALTGPLELVKSVNTLVGEEQAHNSLVRELTLMKHWFDPVASGRRARETISNAPVETFKPHPSVAAVTVQLGNDRVLLNLEGRATLWVLERNRPLWQSADPSADSFLPSEDCFFAIASVEKTYRDWTQQKIQSVSELMQSETSTLRPSAAGLLLFLLLNRHTSKDRGLPLPTSAARSETISDAISGPVLAFAQGISGSSKASDRGVDLYRGWALGEIQRRLGDDLRKEDDLLWIEASALERVIGRLIDAVAGRTTQDGMSAALSAAMGAYEESRSRLASIGIAYERPSSTAELFGRMSSASGVAPLRGRVTR